MKVTILLSGHIRTMKVLKNIFNDFLEINKHHNIHFVYSTSKRNHYQISNENINHKEFKKILDVDINENYITSTFPNTKQTVIFDGTDEYKILYKKLMTTAKNNLEKINLSSLKHPDNVSRIKMFLSEYETELDKSFHVHSFCARAIDEITHMIYGIHYITKNIDSDLIVITRPDVALIGFNIDEMITEGVNNIYTCETNYKNKTPFICPGYIYGSQNLMKNVFNENFSFGENLSFILCAESQIGYNIMKQIPEKQRKFFSLNCCMIGDYKKIEDKKDYLVKYINQKTTDLSEINKKLNAYNFRYYICITSNFLDSYAIWLNQKKYNDILSESDVMFEVADVHTIPYETIDFYKNVVKGSNVTKSTYDKYYKNNMNKKDKIIMFMNDATNEVLEYIDSQLKNNVQLTIIDSMVDCMRPNFNSVEFVKTRNNINKWHCKNINNNVDSDIFDYVPMFYHDSTKNNVINTIKNNFSRYRPVHYKLCLSFTPNTSVFQHDNTARDKFRSLISRIEFIDNIDREYNDDDMSNIMSYKFCIPSITVNRDSFLTWVCISLGVIPIIFRENINNLSAKIYNDVPVLVIDDPEILTEQYLLEQYAIFKNKSYNFDILTKNYWINK